MSEPPDLKSLEKKAYRSTFEDGLWDIFIGLLLMGFSLSWTRLLYEMLEPINLTIVILIWNAIVVVIFILGKKFITVPRMGIVKFGPKREARKTHLRIYLGLNVLLGFIVFILTVMGMMNFLPLFGILTPLLIGLFSFTIPFSIVAYYLDFRRLYIYALVCGCAMFFAELLYPIFGTPMESILAFGLSGGIIVAIGLWFLIKFLRKYPKPEKEGM